MYECHKDCYHTGTIVYGNTKTSKVRRKRYKYIHVLYIPNELDSTVKQSYRYKLNNNNPKV